MPLDVRCEDGWLCKEVSDGGRRPIGLFCTLIRIWMRSRIWVAREWEAKHASDSVFAGPDIGGPKGLLAGEFLCRSRFSYQG